jgi:hypothetical protein
MKYPAVSRVVGQPIYVTTDELFEPRGTRMKLPQTGGCQCGKVRYEITQEPLSVYTCHCLDCQKLTSSAFSLGVVVPESGFRLSGIKPRQILL